MKKPTERVLEFFGEVILTIVRGIIFWLAYNGGIVPLFGLPSLNFLEAMSAFIAFWVVMREVKS